jgi:hypothetical protein
MMICSAKAPRGDDAAQADGAVSDDGHCLARPDLGGDGAEHDSCAHNDLPPVSSGLEVVESEAR